MLRMNMVVWAVGIVAVGVLTGCGSSPVRHGGGTPTASGALRAWASYPVTARPRPVVLVDSPILNPAGGFVDNADKVAYLSSTFTVAASLPTTPAVAGDVPLISARSAFDVLSSPGAPKAHIGSRLTITAVRMSRAVFATDRGQQMLPAWAFTFRGVRHPAYVMALSPSVWWPKPGTAIGAAGRQMSAKVAGARVVLSFTGPPNGTGPCDTEYATSAAESNTAVEVLLRELPNSRSDGVLCKIYQSPRTVAVTLSTPLGDRVLVTEQGVPIPVR